MLGRESKEEPAPDINIRSPRTYWRTVASRERAPTDLLLPVQRTSAGKARQSRLNVEALLSTKLAASIAELIDTGQNCWICIFACSAEPVAVSIRR